MFIYVSLYTNTFKIKDLITESPLVFHWSEDVYKLVVGSSYSLGLEKAPNNEEPFFFIICERGVGHTVTSVLPPKNAAVACGTN